MQTAALIVAAGMSSRMGQFKPLLSIGSISIAQRVVASLRQAGISKVVMVTGCNATALERHLAENDVIFLRNEAYETTQMFDSVKIGLEYLQESAARLSLLPWTCPCSPPGLSGPCWNPGQRWPVRCIRGSRGTLFCSVPD